MTTRELIEYLEGFDPETRIILSKDAEGNSFSPLSDTSFGSYVQFSTWSGEFTTDPGYGVDGEQVICLWPIN